MAPRRHGSVLTKIRDLETNEVGVVDELLSTQLTAVFAKGKLKFYFFKDKGVTWTEYLT